MKKIIVVGGGASGLAAAITAARLGAEVTMLEHKDNIGKKLLVTGNGKCNIANIGELEGKYYSSNETSMQKIYSTFNRFTSKDTISFFESMGLYCRVKKDGGVYPMSEQATTVLDTLREECIHLGVKVITDCEVKNIHSINNEMTVEYIKYIRDNKNDSSDIKNKKDKKATKKNKIVGEEKGQFKCDSIILATGSKALPTSGSDGSGYKLARNLGHEIVLALPALVQLKCEYKNGNNPDIFKIISGVRAQASLRLVVNDECVATEQGELQLTDYGISGIPVFQFSRIAARALFENKKCKVQINFVTDVSENILNNAIHTFEHKCMVDVLSGFVNRKIAEMICMVNTIEFSKKVKDIDNKKISDCVEMLHNLGLEIIGTNSFDNAQVCSGGVSLDEVTDEFESVKCKNVYIVGELLDCDGMCGGYNLQWAWATGVIAGKAASNGGNE